MTRLPWRYAICFSSLMEKNSPNQALEQALAALKASEERFSELAENTEDVFYSRNASTGELLYISPACERRCIGVVMIVDVPRRSAHIPVAQSWRERLSSSSSSSLSAVERR